MNSPEQPAQQSSQPPVSADALDALAPPGRRTRESTKQLMSTPLYRSWLAFMAAAKQQDGTDFSETSRNNLRSLGTGLLSSLLEQCPPDRDCLDYDAHLRGAFGRVDRARAESLIVLAAGTATSKQTQLRSVLVNLIGPWAESQGIRLSDEFPRPAAPHPAHNRLNEIPAFGKLCAELDRLTQRGIITSEPAASVKRKTVLFLQFVYDRLFSEGWNAEAFNNHLTEEFDNLVKAYLESGVVSSASLNTVRSALNRHFRPQVTGAPPPAHLETTRRRDIRPRERVLEHQGEGAGIVITPEAPQRNAVSSEVSLGQYQQVLDSALAALGVATKLSRYQLAALLLNDIRLSSSPHPCLVRVFMPEVSPKIPRPWLSISERSVHEALDVYQRQRRLVPAARLCSLFFVDSNGEPLETTPPKGSSKKHRR